MSETPQADHAFIHESLAAYLAGGLSGEERARVDAHINACPECFDAFTEARDADRAMQRTLAGVAPGGDLEDRIVTHFRERTMSVWKQPAVRRVVYATAACAALAATGVFANFAMRQEGMFNNPLSEQLASSADKEKPGVGYYWHNESGPREDVRGLTQSSSAYAGEAGEKSAAVVNAPANRTMRFNFENETINSILNTVSQQLGMTVISPRDINARVTINVPEPLDQEGATKMVNSLLTPLGYQAVESQTESNPPHAVLRVVALAEAKKSNIPVYQGADPDKIVPSENLITQVIPVQNMDAVKLRSDLASFFSADADVSANAGANSIVVTDTAAKVHRLAEVIQMLDHAKSAQTVIQYRQLTTGKAEDAAKVINDLNGATGSAGAAAGGRGGAAANSPRVYANADARTNTVILNGPPADVQRTLAALDESEKSMEVARGKSMMASNWKLEDRPSASDETRADLPDDAGKGKAQALMQDADKYLAGQKYREAADALRQAVAADPQNQSAQLALRLVTTKIIDRDYESIQHRAGQEVMRENVDSGDHLIPYADLMVYPDNWPEIDRARVSGAADAQHALVTAVPAHEESGIGGGYTPFEKLAARQDDFTKATQNYYGQGILSDNEKKNLKDGVLAFNSSNDESISINKTGSGTLVLSGQQNSFSGGATFTGGISTTQAAPGSTTPTAGTLTATGALSTGTTGRGATGAPAVRDGMNVAFGDGHADLPRGNSGGSAGNFDFGVTPAPTGPNGRWEGAVTGGTSVSADKPGSTLLAANTPAISGKGAPAPAQTQQPPQAQAAVQVASALKIIRNGTVEFEVRSFDDAYLTVSQVTGEEGGFIASTSSDKLANGKVRGTIVVRVPPERLERFLLKIRALGDLKAQQLAAADVTKQYTDTESELRGLRTMEQRLIDLIKNGKGEVKDLVEAERQLGDYRVRIEKLEGEIRYYNNLVSLATITITAYEKDIAKPTAASEQENVNLSVETEEVEAQYAAARRTLDDAKARIVESQLRNTDADHVAAHIVADVPQDKADFVAGQLKTLGKVASFNRDRRQTTTGGTGGPPPAVEVEKKDTRITIDLFNLANLSPRETTVIRVAVPDVEAAYRNILGQVRATWLQKTGAAAPGAPAGEAQKAGAGSLTLTDVVSPTFTISVMSASAQVGRIISSNLTGQLPEQMAADIRAEVRAENADAVLAAIKGSGEVLTSSLSTNADAASTTGAKRGIVLTLVNFAGVQPKELTTLNIAVRDVEGSYKALLGEIRRDVPKELAAITPLLPGTEGRVLSSNLNAARPEQMTADVLAEVRSDQMEKVLQALKAAPGNELMNAVVSESQEAVNVTRQKQRLQVRFINVAAIAAREVRTQNLVAANVTAAYRALGDSMDKLSAAGVVRVVASQLNQTDPRNVRATVDFEVRRDALATFEDELARDGIEFLTGSSARSTDTVGTLDSKVAYRVSLQSIDSLEPRQTTSLGIKVDDVEATVEATRASMQKLLPAEGGGTTVKEVTYGVSTDNAGTVVAHWVLDVPAKQAAVLQAKLSSLGRVETSSQSQASNNVPDKAFARARFDVQLVSKPLTAILPPEKSVGHTVRAALTNAAGALIFSLYLVLTGILFIAPFALLIWPAWAVIRRKKKV